MMSRFFSNPATVLRMREGPLGRFVDPFAKQLSELRFSRQSSRTQILHVANLSRWLCDQELNPEDLDSGTIDRYLRHQRRRGRIRRGHHAALMRLLSVLREHGIATEHCARRDPGPRERIEQEFERFLSLERGLSPATLANYLPFVHWFLSERFGRRPIRLDRLCPTDVTGFVQRHAHEFAPGRI